MVEASQRREKEMADERIALADELEKCPLCPWPGSDLWFVAGLALQGHQRDLIVSALREAKP
jgi:hypothetical protein